MEDRAFEAPVERLRQLAPPLDGEAVIAQRVVLVFQLGAFARVHGQPEAARSPEGVAR
jgi:hypothetical protein